MICLSVKNVNEEVANVPVIVQKFMEAKGTTYIMCGAQVRAMPLYYNAAFCNVCNVL